MKKRDLQELKTKTLEEIRGTIKNLEKDMVNAALELKMGREKNVHHLAHLKRSIAQAKTIAKMKEILEKENQKKGEVTKNVKN